MFGYIANYIILIVSIIINNYERRVTMDFDDLDKLIYEAVRELRSKYQIQIPSKKLKKLKQDIIHSGKNKQEIVIYIEQIKNKLIRQYELQNEVKNGKIQSNFQDILDTIQILFSNPNLASKLSIYGGTTPYLLTREEPKRIIGDIDTHVNLADMPQIRKIIEENPEIFEILSDTLNLTGEDYGFEMMVNGVNVSVFPTIADDRGMIVRNFHEHELTNEITVESTLFYGIDESKEIITCDVYGQPVRMISPEFTYITKSAAGREKDLQDIEVLKDVVSQTKLDIMRQSMYKLPEKLESRTVQCIKDREQVGTTEKSRQGQQCIFPTQSIGLAMGKELEIQKLINTNDRLNTEEQEKTKSVVSNEHDEHNGHN